MKLIRNLLEAAKKPAAGPRSILSTMGQQPAKLVNFNCQNHHLTSLEGGPQETERGFVCNFNELTSLEHGPKKVGGSYYCNANKLTSLQHAPAEVLTFDCSDNQLTDLEGCPTVNDNLLCGDNKLTSLKGAPRQVHGTFYCSSNQLTSFEGGPEFVNGHVNADYNEFTSLHNIHKHLKEVNGYLDLEYNDVASHVLGLLLIKGLTEVKLDNRRVAQIINKHLKAGRDVVACQEELMAADLDEYAQL